MQRGYVKVWRKIEDSGLIQLPNTLALFMHLLLNATYKDRKVGTTTGVVELKRGQYISGIHKLSNTLEQTVRQIRTSIDRLVNLGVITVEATNKYSIYTIENYGLYQDIDTQNDNQTTIKRQSNDKETTTKQELNNLNIKEKDTTPLALLEAMGIPKDLAKDYIQIRNKAKKPTTKTAMSAIKKHAEANGMTFLEAIQICAEKSWVGFDVSWLAGEGKKKTDLGWRKDDNSILTKARELKIGTAGLDRFQLIAKIEAKIYEREGR